MAKSSGILAYRFVNQRIEFLLLKPGGPFYKNSNNGVWTIPKGGVQGGETEIEAAKREFKEETGFVITSNIQTLGEFKLRRGKILHVFMINEDFDLGGLSSKYFELEYPKGSGQMRDFPEIEMGEWMTLDVARLKISPGQLPILQRVVEELGYVE